MHIFVSNWFLRKGASQIKTGTDLWTDICKVNEELPPVTAECIFVT
jgi:hypothetical protein